MTTTRKTPPWRQAEPASVADSPVTVRQRIQGTLNRHDGLVDAREKLADLEGRRTSKQAELDQVQAAVGAQNLEALAARVASGDNLESHEGLFSRRDSLQQQMEAFSLAVARQRSAVERQVREASGNVSDDLKPEFQAHAAAFLESLRTMRAAFEAMRAFHQAAAEFGVTLTKEFNIVATANIHGVLNAAKHIENEWSAVR